MHPTNEPDILIVDDTPANLLFLSAMLKERGYKARPVPSGRLALQAAESRPPDLILLDINMPEMSGYEVCTRLKADERLKDVPVIFISALNEAVDKVAAFSAGGVDYISKPFHFEEVEARVGAHLRLRQLQVELEHRNRELQGANDELQRLQALRDNLTAMIVHDMRSPLSALITGRELLEMTDGSKLSARGREYLDILRTGGDNLLEMINSLLDVNKLEAGELELQREDCDLGALAHTVAATLSTLARGPLEVRLPDAAVVVSADRDLIRRVLQNLVANALKFTPAGGTVTIAAEVVPEGVTMSVIDTGRGIPPEYHERIFEKFGQVHHEGPRVGTGLGLTFCRLVVTAHGGEIGVESEVGKGSRFWFTLPKG